jgi:hypothetical protein
MPSRCTPAQRQTSKPPANPIPISPHLTPLNPQLLLSKPYQHHSSTRCTRQTLPTNPAKPAHRHVYCATTNASVFIPHSVIASVILSEAKDPSWSCGWPHLVSKGGSSRYALTPRSLRLASQLSVSSAIPAVNPLAFLSSSTHEKTKRAGTLAGPHNNFVFRNYLTLQSSRKRSRVTSYKSRITTHPPAIDGTSNSLSPSFNAEASPPRNRMSSSFKYTLMNCRI